MDRDTLARELLAAPIPTPLDPADYPALLARIEEALPDADAATRATVIALVLDSCSYCFGSRVRCACILDRMYGLRSDAI